MPAAKGAKAAPKKDKKDPKSKKAVGKDGKEKKQRSRYGCLTCRGRRKHCEGEGRPCCSECLKLGLPCVWLRPHWWNDVNGKKRFTRDLKEMAKEQKQRERLIRQGRVPPPPREGFSPQEITHKYCSHPMRPEYMDFVPRPVPTRPGGSIPQQQQPEFDFNAPMVDNNGNINNPTLQPNQTPFPTPQVPNDMMFAPFNPFQAEGKTDHGVFTGNMNAMPQPFLPGTGYLPLNPPTPEANTLAPILPMPDFQGMNQSVPMDRRESAWSITSSVPSVPSLAGSSVGEEMMAFSQEGSPAPMVISPPAQVPIQYAIELDEGDQQLLNYFREFVVPTLFPMLELNQPNSLLDNVILPALQQNSTYLHCCLSIAAQHIKAVYGDNAHEGIDQDIMRHRYATVSSLVGALTMDEDHARVLQAALGVVFFQSRVGHFEEALPDIPWHQHFHAVTSLVQKLNIDSQVKDFTGNRVTTPFNMILTSWIDIMSSTVYGRTPMFADLYRSKLLDTPNPTAIGLRELMGCDDRVMYIISEIASLESLKLGGLDDLSLCQYVYGLGEQLDLTEREPAGNNIEGHPYREDGSLDAEQLSRNISSCFRVAARIYLCCLVPGFTPSQPSCIELVDRLARTLTFIPKGVEGLDRLLTWVHLVVGSVSTAGSNYRNLFEERVAAMGELANHGSFGRMQSILRELWAEVERQALSCTTVSISPGRDGGGDVLVAPQMFIHWRDIMMRKGDKWDALLMM